MPYKKIIFKCFLIFFIALFTAGCSDMLPLQVITKRELIIYSDLDGKFVNELVDLFRKSKKIDIGVRVVNELNGEKIQADVILSNAYNVQAFDKNNSLNKLECLFADQIPQSYRSSNDTWVGIFYDPLVFVINQEFSRNFGQENIHTWQDLLTNKDIRVVLESFTNSPEQKNYLGALASNFGETHIFNYFSQLGKHILQYFKYASTPIRIVLSGDADLALCSLNHISQYRGDDFSAYIIEPEDGTPITMYAAGIFKGSDSKEEANIFIDWLLCSPQLEKINIRYNTGYRFFLSENINDFTNPRKVFWLNTKYSDPEKLDDLVRQWLEKIRFNNISQVAE